MQKNLSNIAEMDRAVHEKNLYLLISGRFVSNFMTLMFNFAQGFYVLQIRGSAVDFSAVIIASILPRAFLNFFAGIWADRFNKKNIMVWSDFAAGLITLSFMVLFRFYSESVILFIALSLLLSMVNTVFSIANNAALPEMVGEDLVLKSNSIQQSLRAVIGVFGPLCGGLAYTYMSMEQIFLLNGISFLFSALTEYFIIFEKAKRNTSEKTAFKEHLDILRTYLKENPVLKSLFLLALSMQVFFEPMSTVVLIYICQTALNLSEIQYSVIQASAACGTILASILTSSLFFRGRELSWLFRLLLFQGLLFGAWSFPALINQDTFNSWTLTAGFLLLQFFGRFLNTIQNIPLFSAFQTEVPEAIRGRVFGLFFSVMMLFVPGTMLLFSAILQWQWQWAPLLAGSAIVILSFLGSRNRYLRSFVAKHKETQG